MAPQTITRCCDLVMKGGITSGVVYPKAVEQIARSFYFMGIGGTSAGAIASCLTAAAEYRRRTQGTFEGFEMLSGLSDELAAEGRMMRLFHPQPTTAKLFEKLLAWQGGELGGWKKLRLIWSLYKKTDKTLGPVRENFFGFCSGMGNDAALTPWLSHWIDRIAGVDRPLTFGDLHNAPLPPGLEEVVGECSRSIDLRAVTTCLTFGRPYEIPFADRDLAFDPAEWRRLFPEEVVSHLVATANPDSSVSRDGKLQLPEAADLPVVVAARMSLSFPGLLSMVPMWAVDYRLDVHALRRVWFSDGGITSNFPLHRFDGLYPQWPTLGITLQDVGRSGLPVRPRMRREKSWTWMPAKQGDGSKSLRYEIDDAEGTGAALLRFALGIFRSAQIWHDEAFLRLPGYRDRVIEVWMGPGEGGMSLNMPPATIAGLALRGADAGRQIAERLAEVSGASAVSWEAHRWTRYRSAMCGLMASLQHFRASVEAKPMAGDRTLWELLEAADQLATHPVKSAKQRQAMKELTEALLAVAEKAEGLDICQKPEDRLFSPFCNGPNPAVEIGTRATF